MSEEKKKPAKKLHVDTLHIHANEIVLHQNTPEGQSTQDQGQGGFQQIPRDFWGFPIRQAQPQPQAQPAAQAEEGSGEEEQTEQPTNEGANTEAEAEGQNQPQPEGQQGPPQGPPFGWI
ncbi:hypothetical protein GCM10011391_32740 [Pullulanibacillus camelliae]|uniref:Uncharacterized protein n=1 Tax=Pullulanibacillus camelliae TaxID=1707096 RepID=A0A8J2YM42_9BACL|nr:hypothetical protein [Pullulanibacillus camelliae]GGE51406.1 hypothetical protein GCM10011391_32740 [Pullulanibacillus camelliae]